MNQLSQAINDKTQTLTDGNYLNADPDKQNAYKQAVAKAEALLNKQSGTNEVQAQVESITNEVNAAKQALNGNDNLANAKQQAKQQLVNLTHLNDAQNNHLKVHKRHLLQMSLQLIKSASVRSCDGIIKK